MKGKRRHKISGRINPRLATLFRKRLQNRCVPEFCEIFKKNTSGDCFLSVQKWWCKNLFRCFNWVILCIKGAYFFPRAGIFAALKNDWENSFCCQTFCNMYCVMRQWYLSSMVVNLILQLSSIVLVRARSFSKQIFF